MELQIEGLDPLPNYQGLLSLARRREAWERPGTRTQLLPPPGDHRSEREKEVPALLHSVAGEAGAPWRPEQGRWQPIAATSGSAVQNAAQSFTYSHPPKTDSSHTDRQNHNHPCHTRTYTYPSKFTQGCTLVHHLLSPIPNSKNG